MCLNHESPMFQRGEKNAQIKHKKYCSQNFHFFTVLLFSQNFWMKLKIMPLSIIQSNKYS